MSSHHDHDSHHVTEEKPVSFRVPLIMALVTILLILLLVSTCDGGHHNGKCEHEGVCTEECAKHEEHGGHEATEHAAATTEHATEAVEEHHTEDTTKMVVAEPIKVDSLSNVVKSTEEHSKH